MNNKTIENIDGYRICWLSNEIQAAVVKALLQGDYDGLGFNPYNGWAGKGAELFNGELRAKALVFPFADRIGFDGEWLRYQSNMEMLLLSEFSGIACIESRALRVLRLLFKPSITFGDLFSLEALYIREPASDLLLQLPRNAPGLTTLQINGGSLSRIEGIEMLRRLKNVELLNLKNLKSVSELSGCIQLETLIIRSVRAVHDIERTLANLKSLRVLRLIDCGTLDNFDFLESLKLDEFRCSRTKVLTPHNPALSQIKTVFVG